MRKKHIEDCKVGTEERLVQNFGPTNDLGFVNFLIHQPVFHSEHHPQREARTTSIVESSVIMPNNVTHCPRHVHHPQHNHGQTERGLKQINHGEVIRTL